MSAIDTLMGQPAAQAIGWALVHFVWQGTLVAILTAAALALLRTSAADVRYVVTTIALTLMFTLPAVTVTQMWTTNAGLEVGTTATAQRGLIAGATATTAASFRRSTIENSAPPRGLSRVLSFSGAGLQRGQRLPLDPWLPIILATWLSGVVLLSLRLMSGWLWVQRMKSHGARPARDGWQTIATRLSRRLHISRAVTLVESTLVDVPTVIGWMRPVVLLPVSALSGLTPRQIEAILAHELAHIRRHDYLVNLLQTLVETLLFYHPAVWWLSRRIRIERENCCDDLAVSLCGDRVAYAQALADLEGGRGRGREFALAATGGSLVQRVRRLLGAPTHAGRAPGWLAGSAAILVMLGIAVSALRIVAYASPAAEPGRVRSTSRATASAHPVAAVRPSAALRQVRAYSRQFFALLEIGRATFAPQIPPLPPLPPDPPEPPVPPTPPDPPPPMSAEAEPPAPPEAPASPASPAPSEPPAPPDAPAIAMAFGASPQTHATVTYDNNGRKLEVRYDGDVEFTADDTDVKRMTPGGLLRIKDDGFFSAIFSGRTVEFTADAAGAIKRRYWVGSSERPFEPEGRQWLATVLPDFIRQTGIGAPARVARILKARGPAGVLAEISLIKGSWAKAGYFRELLKTPLDASTVRQVLVQAGREIDSDFELASLLIAGGETLLVDEAARQAYFDAARTIQSDFEMHRVYAAAVKRGPLTPALLASVLNASRDIDSDFEEASFLVEVAKLQPLDTTTRGPFFDALATVGSDFEHHRVLSALTERTNQPPDVIGAMLASAANLSSDFELASFLAQIVKQQPVEGALRAPFFRAIDSIDSAFERGRVLEALAKRTDTSPETLLALLRATAGVKGNFEASNVLLAVAATHPVSGAARDAYIGVAEKLGDFEQGRVMSALVRNERRK